MSDILTKGKLRQLVAQWLNDGKQLAGPRYVKQRDGAASSHAQLYDLIQYGRLEAAEQLLLDGFVRPANSIKESFFPRHETLYCYKIDGKQTVLHPIESSPQECIIVGARPCDAAALSILDHVFNWDCRDELYNRRRERTTVITVACREHDAHCFCTSVGCGPSDTRGSDVMLFELDCDTYEVRCYTDKGRRLFAGQTQPSVDEASSAAGPTVQVDLTAVNKFLAAGYEQPQWPALTRRCLSCGACAYTCPTCHCFDIVDEGTATGGLRVRNWDACQFAMFTAHASGHNPRSAQSQRQRQRIYHKFQIYPKKFGDVLCTGCGNCTRNCPVGLGVLNVLKEIAADSPAATQ